MKRATDEHGERRGSMLATEFEQEWAKQATGERFAPPKQLRFHESEYIRAFYQRSELDSIVFGADRHAKFVTWAIKNYDWLSRDAESAYYRMIGDLQTAAQTKPV